MTSLASRAAAMLETPRTRFAVRCALWPYALVVAAFTLWPALKVPMPVPRSDLIIHLVCFGLLGLLVIAAGLFGPAFSRRNLLVACIVATAFAALDEGLQAIPFLNRTCAWDDMAANVMGILTAVLIMGLWGRAVRP
ncbi:MAG: VanZ family protein [Phycisphaerales bacterium]